MTVEIYYFSGTGNSLAVARDIAVKLDGQLISIPSVIDKESIATDANVIGIVFPVYYVGLNYIPLIIRRFVTKLENLSGKYVFAVCTYGGGSGHTLKILDQLIRQRGGRLAAGFGVMMPQNAFDKPFENRDRLCNNWKEKQLERVVQCVTGRKETRLETDPFLFRIIIAILVRLMKVSVIKPFFIKPIYQSAGCDQNWGIPFADAMQLLDRSYHTDEKCKGCGICARVCPVGNIKMIDEKPVWQHRCENCLACVNWCPQKAIHGYAELPRQRRYHHPDVKLAEVMMRE